MGWLVFVAVFFGGWMALAKLWLRQGHGKALAVSSSGCVSFVAAALIGAWAGGVFDDPPPTTATTVPASAAPVAVPRAPASSAPTVAVSSSRKTITHNTFGCVSVETFRDASSYWENDERALLAQLLDAGQCELLRTGDAVILVDVAFMRHIVVRRPGEATKLVTFLSAVD